VTHVHRGSTPVSKNLYYYRITNKLYIYSDLDIYYLLQIGFPHGDSGWKTYTEIVKRQLYTKGETIHKTMPKHRINKIEKEYKK